ncbi:hypothetical protein F4604DRAFT_1533945, partial [Suillus subluteus]
MVKERKYQTHLSLAVESKEVRAGQVDGEILEILWAPFNKISPTAWSMSQAHCQEKILMWEINEQKAMEKCGEYLDIYQLQINKAPTMAEIQLKLTESENADTGKPGTVSWLITGINLEDLQDGLRADIQQLPTDATPAQKASIEEKRQRLAARIAKFHETADVMTAGMDLRIATVHSDDPRFCCAENDDYEWEEVSDGEILEDLDEEILAEEMGIWMP